MCVYFFVVYLFNHVCVEICIHKYRCILYTHAHTRTSIHTQYIHFSYMPVNFRFRQFRKLSFGRLVYSTYTANNMPEYIDMRTHIHNHMKLCVFMSLCASVGELVCWCKYVQVHTYTHYRYIGCIIILSCRCIKGMHVYMCVCVFKDSFAQPDLG